MSKVNHTDVQHTAVGTIREYLREINERLRRLTQGGNDTFIKSIASVSIAVAANGTYPIHLANGPWRVMSIAGVTSAGTGSVTPRINTTNITLSPAAPLSVSTTAARAEATAANGLTDLDVLDIVVTGLTGNLGVTVELEKDA